MEGAWLLLMLLLGQWAPAPAVPLLQLKARGRSQKASARFLQDVELLGTVVEMRDFDGKNIDLIWRPRAELLELNNGVPWYAEALRDLDDSSPGVSIEFVRPVS